MASPLNTIREDPEFQQMLIEELSAAMEKVTDPAKKEKVRKAISQLSYKPKTQEELGAVTKESNKFLKEANPGFDLGAHATAAKRGMASTVASPEDVAGIGASLGAAGSEESDLWAGPKRLLKTFTSDPGAFASRDPMLAIPSMAFKGIKELALGGVQGISPEAAETAALEQLTSDQASMQKDPRSAFTESLAPAVAGLGGRATGPALARGAGRVAEGAGVVKNNLMPNLKAAAMETKLPGGKRSVGDLLKPPSHVLPEMPKRGARAAMPEDMPWKAPREAPEALGAPPMSLEDAASPRQLFEATKSPVPRMDAPENMSNVDDVFASRAEEVDRVGSEMLEDMSDRGSVDRVFASREEVNRAKMPFAQTPDDMESMAQKMLNELASRKKNPQARVAETKQLLEEMPDKRLGRARRFVNQQGDRREAPTVISEVNKRGPGPDADTKDYGNPSTIEASEDLDLFIDDMSNTQASVSPFGTTEMPTTRLGSTLDEETLNDIINRVVRGRR